MDIADLRTRFERYDYECQEKGKALPGLSVFRRTVVSDIEAFVYEPVVCLILQGSKTTSIGDQAVELRPGDALVVSHDLPVVSRITRASPETPYLAAILSLDLALLRGLHHDFALDPHPSPPGRALAAGSADPSWIAPLVRYLDLTGDPLDAAVLGPAILREIHYRLLRAPVGAMLRRYLVAGSPESRVARAIHSLRAGFRTPLSVPGLARDAGMSPSSFHQHFRAVTGTTPLQYLKDLRLIEAKTLLTERRNTVAEAAFAVGYESPTHFSRDYRRKFGRPPSRDTAGPDLARAAPIAPPPA